jgi:hypothetical protein
VPCSLPADKYLPHHHIINVLRVLTAPRDHGILLEQALDDICGILDREMSTKIDDRDPDDISPWRAIAQQNIIVDFIADRRLGRSE